MLFICLTDLSTLIALLMGCVWRWIVRQRMGEDLNDLEIDELRGLEQNLDNSLKIVRERKVGWL